MMPISEIRTRLQHIAKHAHNLLEHTNPLSSVYSDASPIEREVLYILENTRDSEEPEEVPRGYYTAE